MFCRPTLGRLSGGAGLVAAAGQIGHDTGGEGGQGVGGRFGNGDGLEGEEFGVGSCAPRGQECARCSIILADGAAVICCVEVARGIERQATYKAQIRADIADVSNRGIELADGVLIWISGVEVARRIKRQAPWAAQIRADIADVSTRRIELADGVVAVIRGVEVTRGIERQAD